MSSEHYTNPNHTDPTGGRLFPIPLVTPEALAMIPLGSEVVIVNGPDGTIECGDWTESEARRLGEQAGELTDEQREMLFMFYLPPMVPKNLAIITALNKHGFARESGVYRAIQEGALTPAAFAALIRDVASLAREEVRLS